MFEPIEEKAYTYGTEYSKPLKRVVWLTSDSDPQRVSALMEASARNRFGLQPHFIYHPISGQTVRMIPDNFDGRATRIGGVIEVVVVGTPESDFTRYPCPKLTDLVDHFTSLGIPPWFPYGPPVGQNVPTPGVQNWHGLEGHYGASQVPGGERLGPGWIDITKIMRSSVYDDPEPLPLEVFVPEGETVSQEHNWADPSEVWDPNVPAGDTGELDAVLNDARSHLAMSGRPNEATKWYSSRHGSIYLSASWCDMFVSWVASRAKVLPLVGEFAFCPYHVRWFKNKGQWGSNPRRGAIVFYDWNGDGQADHVGIVESVRSDSIVAIEGNTSDRVARRIRTPDTILGYGYPAYTGTPSHPDAYPGTVLQKGSKGGDVTRVQEQLIKKGFSVGKWGADGDFGNATDAAVKAFQKSRKLTVDGQVGPNTWKALFG